MDQSYNEQLGVLIERPMTAVSFVMDYLRFEFEDVFLTALAPAYVQVDQVRYEFGQPGFCEAACQRITKEVVKATHDDLNEILIQFVDGSMIGIRVGLADYKGKEQAILQIPSKNLVVWNA